jgi:hypothetical protein
MKYDGIAKVQHYIPQFILRNFGAKKKNRLHVFDKQKGSLFVTNIRNVACESRFYDFKLQSQILTLEPALSRIEDDAKPLFSRILDEDSLLVLSEKERTSLSIFFSIQFTRTKWFLEQYKDIPTILATKLRQMAESEESLKGLERYLRISNKNEITMEFTHMISEAPKNYAVQFANKTWVLLKADRKYPFIMGDNPLALQNIIDMKPHGNIGLAVRGIEIYFPLSPTRALALWCPSHEETFRKAFSDLSVLAHISPHLVEMKIHNLQIIKETIAAINSGQPLLYRHDNVVNFNSLQILYAERYVFSNMDDFSLVREMIADNANVRCGPRIQVE